MKKILFLSFLLISTIVNGQKLSVQVCGGLQSASVPYKNESFGNAGAAPVGMFSIKYHLNSFRIGIYASAQSPCFNVDYNRLKFEDQKEHILPTGETFGKSKYYYSNLLINTGIIAEYSFRVKRLTIVAGANGGPSFGGNKDNTNSGKPLNDMRTKCSGFNAGAHTGIEYNLNKLLFLSGQYNFSYIKLNYTDKEYFDFYTNSIMIGVGLKFL